MKIGNTFTILGSTLLLLWGCREPKEALAIPERAATHDPTDWAGYRPGNTPPLIYLDPKAKMQHDSLDLSLLTLQGVLLLDADTLMATWGQPLSTHQYMVVTESASRLSRETERTRKVIHYFYKGINARAYGDIDAPPFIDEIRFDERPELEVVHPGLNFSFSAVTTLEQVRRRFPVSYDFRNIATPNLYAIYYMKNVYFDEGRAKYLAEADVMLISDTETPAFLELLFLRGQLQALAINK